jgi:hypothetical protein
MFYDNDLTIVEENDYQISIKFFLTEVSSSRYKKEKMQSLLYSKIKGGKVYSAVFFAFLCNIHRKEVFKKYSLKKMK